MKFGDIKKEDILINESESIIVDENDPEMNKYLKLSNKEWQKDLDDEGGNQDLYRGNFKFFKNKKLYAFAQIESISIIGRINIKTHKPYDFVSKYLIKLKKGERYICIKYTNIRDFKKPDKMLYKKDNINSPDISKNIRKTNNVVANKTLNIVDFHILIDILMCLFDGDYLDRIIEYPEQYDSFNKLIKTGYIEGYREPYAVDHFATIDDINNLPDDEYSCEVENITKKGYEYVMAYFKKMGTDKFRKQLIDLNFQEKYIDKFIDQLQGKAETKKLKFS